MRRKVFLLLAVITILFTGCEFFMDDDTVYEPDTRVYIGNFIGNLNDKSTYTYIGTYNYDMAVITMRQFGVFYGASQFEINEYLRLLSELKVDYYLHITIPGEDDIYVFRMR